MDLKIKESRQENEPIPTPQPNTSRPRIDVKELEYTDITDQKLAKLPNHFPIPVPFSIQNCKNSSFFIMNPLQQCQVDDVENCFIYIGPTQGSVFLRNCKNCVVVVACHQFRTRDCSNLKLGLYCLYQPTFETSTDIEICPFEYEYPELKNQFDFSKPNDVRFYDFSNQDIRIGQKCPIEYPVGLA
jgi:protein XRP2